MIGVPYGKKFLGSKIRGSLKIAYMYVEFESSESFSFNLISGHQEITEKHDNYIIARGSLA